MFCLFITAAGTRSEQKGNRLLVVRFIRFSALWLADPTTQERRIIACWLTVNAKGERLEKQHGTGRAVYSVNVENVPRSKSWIYKLLGAPSLKIYAWTPWHSLSHQSHCHQAHVPPSLPTFRLPCLSSLRKTKRKSSIRTRVIRLANQLCSVMVGPWTVTIGKTVSL